MPSRSRSSVPGGALTPERLAGLRARFECDPVRRMAQNAVCKTPVDDIALNRQIVTAGDFSFSHTLDDWKVTHQKATGRCWLFAGLNLLRVGAMKKMKLKEFEFSQNYLFSWDKLERTAA